MIHAAVFRTRGRWFWDTIKERATLVQFWDYKGFNLNRRSIGCEQFTNATNLLQLQIGRYTERERESVHAFPCPCVEWRKHQHFWVRRAYWRCSNHGGNILSIFEILFWWEQHSYIDPDNQYYITCARVANCVNHFTRLSLCYLTSEPRFHGDTSNTLFHLLAS